MVYQRGSGRPNLTAGTAAGLLRYFRASTKGACPLPFQNFLNHIIMKDAIEKLAACVEELRTSADPKDGGCYLVIGAAPVEKADSFLFSVNGKGFEIMAALAYAFKHDPHLADIARHALMFGGLVPDRKLEDEKAEDDQKDTENNEE